MKTQTAPRRPNAVPLVRKPPAPSMYHARTLPRVQDVHDNGITSRRGMSSDAGRNARAAGSNTATGAEASAWVPLDPDSSSPFLIAFVLGMRRYSLFTTHAPHWSNAANSAGRAPGGGAPGARPDTATFQAASLTSIFLACVRGGFGMVIFKTPFDIVALTVDGSMAGGSCSMR